MSQHWKRKCFHCMRDIDNPNDICPICGWNNQHRVNGEGLLKQTVLNHGRYLTGHALGHDGFGVVYNGFGLEKQRKKWYIPALAKLDIFFSLNDL